jgi:uncharacterized phage infection (PIP) family protein YhgE
MAIDPKTAQEFTRAVGLVDKVGKARKATEPKYDDLKKRLAVAIKAKDGPKLELYSSALEAMVSLIAKGSAAVDLALGSMREVETDADFVASRLAAIDKLMTIISEARTSFAAMFKDAKDQQNKCEEALASSQDAGEDATRTLARLQKRADDDRDQLKELFGKSDALATKAQGAVDRRDAKALKAAQDAYDALHIEPALFLHGKLMEDVAAFGEQAAKSKDYGADVQAEVKDGVKDIQNKAAGVRVYVEQLTSVSKMVAEMSIAEIDVKKAAKTLSVDRASEAALAKVLNGPPASMVAGLDQIGAKLDPKQKGKDMLEALKKAKVV